MKHLLLSVCIALSGLVIVQSDAEARRLGGGSSAGMKRTTPAATPDATPAKPAQAAPAPAAPAAPTAAATPPKRSWMGPLAGLAAGLGLAALASHLGFGAGLANIMSILLVVMLGAVLLGFVMKYLRNRNAPAARGLQGMQFANAGFGSAPPSFNSGSVTPLASATRNDVEPVAPITAAPIGFDTAEFETIAKRVFIRLQAANDAGDLDDLRRFTTPEMFAVARQELLERPSTPQQTDVVQLQAAVAEHAEEDGRQIVSVRFSGLIREVKDAPAEAFNEIWHLVRPLDGSREWAIAGIQQAA
ncbi:MAG: Tim44 domain-containing protein [Burkholderiaceae bacterium]|nr:Tim44 domain-containing protein [Burkholderiaceae bacterium]